MFATVLIYNTCRLFDISCDNEDEDKGGVRKRVMVQDSAEQMIAYPSAPILIFFFFHRHHTCQVHDI